ncbi:MAG: hypothetical protein MZV64_59525 [Ignavibacteriales bacterium]|nr:hypothetical protein [Ignavibacteriales bacterium]
MANIIGAATANARGYNGSHPDRRRGRYGSWRRHAPTAHRDINGRVTAVYNWPGVTDSCLDHHRRRRGRCRLRSWHAYRRFGVERRRR